MFSHTLMRKHVACPYSQLTQYYIPCYTVRVGELSEAIHRGDMSTYMAILPLAWSSLIRFESCVTYIIINRTVIKIPGSVLFEARQ